LRCFRTIRKANRNVAAAVKTTFHFLRSTTSPATGRSIGASSAWLKVNIGGNGLPYWLKKNNFPPGFQVLCANCNFAKRNSRYCPHEIRRGVDMNGEPVEIAADPIIPVMPRRKGPERDAWLKSPEGQKYREQQASAKRGRPRKKPQE